MKKQEILNSAEQAIDALEAAGGRLGAVDLPGFFDSMELKGLQTITNLFTKTQVIVDGVFGWLSVGGLLVAKAANGLSSDPVIDVADLRVMIDAAKDKIEDDEAGEPIEAA